MVENCGDRGRRSLPKVLCSHLTPSSFFFLFETAAARRSKKKEEEGLDFTTTKRGGGGGGGGGGAFCSDFSDSGKQGWRVNILIELLTL